MSIYAEVNVHDDTFMKHVVRELGGQALLRGVGRAKLVVCGHEFTVNEDHDLKSPMTHGGAKRVRVDVGDERGLMMGFYGATREKALELLDLIPGIMHVYIKSAA